MTIPNDVTGKTIHEAEFDPMVKKYTAGAIVLVMIISVVGIPFIPFGLLFSWWYAPESLRRMSARLTTNAVQINKGVFFRKEATIPLNRVTDVRLHDDPWMRMCGVRGLKVETAGQSGQDAGSEGDLIGVVDPVAFRDAILRQRQLVIEGGAQTAVAASGAAPAAAPSEVGELLAEIRDILARMEAQGRGGKG